MIGKVYVPTFDNEFDNWIAKPNVITNCNGTDNVTMENIKSLSTDIVNISSWRGDGLGSQLTDTMKYIAFYRKNSSKFHYYYVPWDFTIHKDSTQNNNNSLYSIEKFMNIGQGERNIHNINDECICCLWNILWENDLTYQTTYLFDNDTLKYLKEKYWRNKLNIYLNEIYDRNEFNVGVHIRRGDATQHNRGLNDKYYITIMKYIFDQQIKINKTKVITFYIYTQRIGFNKTHFENILNDMDMYKHKLFKLKYKIELSLNLTFHGLIICDALIMSKSAFSFGAAILSNAKYVYYAPWLHRPLKHWIYVIWGKTKMVRDTWKRDKCKCNTLNSDTYYIGYNITVCNSWHCDYNYYNGYQSKIL